MSAQAAPRINDKREIFGWAMYDWAISAFSTTVGTVFLGPYLAALARAARKGEKVSCELAGYEQAGAGTVSDIDCVDAKGAPICMLRGVECFQVDSY